VYISVLVLAKQKNLLRAWHTSLFVMVTVTETAVETDKFLLKEDIKWHDLPTPEEPNIPLPPPSVNPTAILDADKGTPDEHVPRDPRLIRLTGVHPFNVEPPLTALYKEGMKKK
jgi:nitrate reductase (NAD(P)H)